MGPFEMWDAIGVQETLNQMTSMGFEAPQWVHSMLSSGASSFYKHKQDSACIGISHQHRIKLYPARNTLSFLPIAKRILSGK